MKKFLFDTNDFNNTAAEADRPVYSENELNAAKTESYESGKTAGLATAKKNQEEQIIVILQSVTTLVEKMIADDERREIMSMTNATRLTLRIARKLLPQFAQDFALTETEKVILDSLDVRKDEPRIAVTIPTAHLETLKARIDTLAQEKGYAGKLILVADDNMAATDCRVEWADGGAEKVYNKLFAQIEAAFQQAIGGIEAQMETPPTTQDKNPQPSPQTGEET